VSWISSVGKTPATPVDPFCDGSPIGVEKDGDTIVAVKAPLPILLEMWPIARLIHYIRNPRKNDHAVDRMVASILEFGFRVPVLARSSGEVIDGPCG